MAYQKKPPKEKAETARTNDLIVNIVATIVRATSLITCTVTAIANTETTIAYAEAETVHMLAVTSYTDAKTSHESYSEPVAQPFKKIKALFRTS